WISAARGQNMPVKITFDVPEGWRGETIQLPPGFAKDFPYRGIEEIRFAPGMFKPDRDDFFSYALVFYFPNQKPLDRKQLHAALLTYYRGLARAVGAKRKPPIQTDSFKLDLKPVEGAAGKYLATLHWVEPFATGKPQRLHLELTWRALGQTPHSTLVTAASPQKKDHAIWPALRKALASVKIHVDGKVEKPDLAAAAPKNIWPSFRGMRASGVAENQNLPPGWDVSKGRNLRFKVAIPGLAHSSPILWGDRLFVTTAISSRADAAFKPGLYGSGKASEDRSVHRWQVICLDAKTGRTLWTKTAAEGKPQDRRHNKATYANATPVTDGRHVVALFGSEGLFAYTVEGVFVWKHDLGRLEVGAYNARHYEWGSASSPILYKNRVIVQCDTQGQSFLRAIDLKTGRTLWNTPRDELPSWGTPTIVRGPNRVELVTNGSNFIRGYDPETGKELWRLGGSSKITAPTPVYAEDRIVVASGRAPERPIFAIRPGAVGDITLKKSQTSNRFVAWSKTQRGPYMPTPLIVGDTVYTLGNAGIVAAYDLVSGKEHYRKRIPDVIDGFSASPVAADGRVYLPSEDGKIYVMAAGKAFKLLTTGVVGEPVMATPAIGHQTLYVRGSRHLFAIGQ
ncbi:MAG: PQQ-binding-like beta-propeller repeat protein, partial [Phycisphaeraceae bacterium]|nr:PQQ-binding-like beta-propeller repeat protein [Phycisphaeraceae bacterium]